MANLRAKSSTQYASLRATVIRADGSIEDLGEIAYYHRNPIKRLLWRIRRAFAR